MKHHYQVSKFSFFSIDRKSFPLQPNRDELQMREPPIPDVWKDVHFTLTIVYPKAKSKEVEAALWAWETFGGIGARTRRGRP